MSKSGKSRNSTPEPGKSPWPWVVAIVLAIAAAVTAAVLLRPGARETVEVPAAPQRLVDPEVYALLEEVQGYLETRRFEEGLAAVDRFLTDHSEDAGAFYARGLLHLGKLNYQEAIDALERAVELDPGHPDAHLKLGIARSRIGALDEANQALETALERRPGLAEAALLLGRNLAQKGDVAAAREYFLGIAEELPAESHFQLGLLARQADDLEAAEEAFRRALAVDPKHLGATSNLGQTLKLRGQLDDGDRFLERHQRLESERYEYDKLREQTFYDWAEASSFIRLAAYELAHQKLARAEANFKKALDLDASSARAAFGLGRTYLEMDNLEEAGRWLAQAKELDPENAGAYFFLGLVKHLEGQYEEARGELGRSRELAPWGAQEFLFLGNALFRTGALEDARLAYEQSVAHEPSRPDAHVQLGLVHYLGGRLEQARGELEKILEIQPDDVDSRMFLGIVTFRLDDLPAARQAFGAALERHALTLQSNEQIEAMLGRYSDLPESGPALDLYRRLRAEATS